MSTKTVELVEQLRGHYTPPGQPLPGGIFLTEVGMNGNGQAPRRCDAIYVGFTNTTGRILVGHELKTSRSDWLQELANPHKAEFWAEACHEWWLVVSDTAIVMPGELPAGWGYMTPGRGRRMKIVQAPDRKGPSHQPEWLAVRSIMARQDTLRAQREEKDRRDIGRIVNERVESEMAKLSAKETLSEEVELGQIEILRLKLSALEKAIGFPINWNGVQFNNQITISELEKFGRAAKSVGDIERAAQTLIALDDRALNNVQTQLDRLRAAVRAVGDA